MASRGCAGIVATLMLASLLAAGPAFPSEPSFRYERDIEINQAGWVKMRLPMEVLQKLSPSGQDWRLTGPGGRPQPVFRLTSPPVPPPTVRKAGLVDVKTVPGGWRVEADLGPARSSHRRLLLDVPGTGLAEDVTLEGSPDRLTWHVLARGALFRLAYRGDTEKTSLEYAPTTDRFLRLFWPESAGFPHWRALYVESWQEDRPGSTVEAPLPCRLSERTDGAVRYLVEAPRAPVDATALGLDMTVPYPLRVRLLVPGNGAWSTVREVLISAGETPVLAAPPSMLRGDILLDLDAGGYKVPPLKGVSLTYRPAYMAFHALRPGTYLFRYGALGRADRKGATSAILPPSSEEVAEAVFGPERAFALPALTAPSLVRGAALPDAPFSTSWSVEAEEAHTGDMTALDLPPGLYREARSDLGDMRLASGGRQVPYVLWRPPGGTRAFELRGGAPEANPEKAASTLTFDLPCESLPITTVVLNAPSAPFTRGVTLEYLRPAGKGAEGPSKPVWAVLSRTTWHCPGISDLPARLVFRVHGVPSRKFRLVFADGDNAPLPSVDIVAWRQRDVLLFPWPGGAGLTLLAGAPALPPPVYDLASLKDELLSRAAITATIDGAPRALHPSRKGSTGRFDMKRWILVLCLAFASAVLLFIFFRAIRDKRLPESGQD